MLRASLAAVAAFAMAGCQSASAAPGVAPVASSATQTATARFHVEGMACERCSGRLSAGLRKLDGVIDAQADHQKKEAVLRYDPARITPERIKQEIGKLGFDVS
jgi:copper chaperone CopZ